MHQVLLRGPVARTAGAAVQRVSSSTIALRALSSNKSRGTSQFARVINRRKLAALDQLATAVAPCRSSNPPTSTAGPAIINAPHFAVSADMQIGSRIGATRVLRQAAGLWYQKRFLATPTTVVLGLKPSSSLRQGNARP